MLGAIMNHIHNYFEYAYYSGDFIVYNGEILFNGRNIRNGYVAIDGCTPNRGVYAPTETGLVDGAFSGKVWLLAPPKDFLQLVSGITAWKTKNPTGAMVSESFGNYSYNRGTSASGAAATWQDAFRSELNAYRHMFTEVNL